METAVTIPLPAPAPAEPERSVQSRERRARHMAKAQGNRLTKNRFSRKWTVVYTRTDAVEARELSLEELEAYLASD